MHDAPVLSVVTMVNDEALYARARASLAAHHADGALEWIPVRPDECEWNAATALNHGLERARAPWVLCAHQDVLYPSQWWQAALLSLLG